jgi:hypothetical protein
MKVRKKLEEVLLLPDLLLLINNITIAIMKQAHSTNHFYPT